MLFVKVYMTILLSLLIIMFISAFLTLEDEERGDFWLIILKISGSATGVMLVCLGFYVIWN